MPRIRISLSTAVKLMFVGALLMWMNTRPISHFHCSGEMTVQVHGIFYEENGDTYEVGGLGWPSSGIYPGERIEVLPGILVNLIFASITLVLSGIFFESRNSQKWVALIIALMIGGCVYLACLLVGSGPIVSDVSLSKAFKPTSQSWRPAAAAFVIVWSLTTLMYVYQILIAYKWKRVSTKNDVSTLEDISTK